MVRKKYEIINFQWLYTVPAMKASDTWKISLVQSHDITIKMCFFTFLIIPSLLTHPIPWEIFFMRFEFARCHPDTFSLCSFVKCKFRLQQDWKVSSSSSSFASYWFSFRNALASSHSIALCTHPCSDSHQIFSTF